MNVAILATGKLKTRAIVVTEHSAAFPEEDNEPCFIQIVVQSDSETLELIEETGFFSLSHLAHSQMQIAIDTYKLKFPPLEIESQNQIPYVKNANVVLFCRLEKTLDLEGNTLIVGRVYDLIMSETPEKPLVNYQKYYCSVDDDRTLVYSPEVKNSRLQDGSPLTPDLPGPSDTQDSKCSASNANSPDAEKPPPRKNAEPPN